MVARGIAGALADSAATNPHRTGGAARNGKAVRGLSREARDALLRHDYAGNGRELENLVERAVVLTRDEVIGLGDLPLSLATSEPEPGEPGSLPAAVEGLERRMIREALVQASTASSSTTGAWPHRTALKLGFDRQHLLNHLHRGPGHSIETGIDGGRVVAAGRQSADALVEAPAGLGVRGAGIVRERIVERSRVEQLGAGHVVEHAAQWPAPVRGQPVEFRGAQAAGPLHPGRRSPHGDRAVRHPGRGGAGDDRTCTRPRSPFTLQSPG